MILPGGEPDRVDEPEVLRPGETRSERPRPEPAFVPVKLPWFLRAGASLMLGVAGVLSLVVGLGLCVSIVGLPIGVPLLLFGLLLVGAAVFVLLGGGKAVVLRSPRP